MNPKTLSASTWKLVTLPKFLSPSSPFVEGKEVIGHIPVDAKGTKHMYIDNNIVINVDLEGSDNVERLGQSTLLAIHYSSREKSPNKPISRDEILY